MYLLKRSIFVLLLLMVGCTSVTVDHYAANKPQLTAEQFFNGKLTAHGVIKNRSGIVTRYFNATINAYWKNNVGTLEEDFLFDDGEQQRRVWTLVAAGDGRYVGTAGDVIGEAEINVAGNSMFLDYVLRIPYGDGTLDLTIDDRMYLVSDRILLNESTLHKFGVNVGSMMLVIKKD